MNKIIFMLLRTRREEQFDIVLISRLCLNIMHSSSNGLSYLIFVLRPSSYVAYNSDEFNSQYICRLVDINCCPIQTTNFMKRDAGKTFYPPSRDG